MAHLLIGVAVAGVLDLFTFICFWRAVPRLVLSIIMEMGVRSFGLEHTKKRTALN